MEKIIELFTEIRQTMDAEIKDSLKTFYVYDYDPVTEYLMEKEIKKIIHNTMQTLYPYFPKDLLPQFRIKREEINILEVQTQAYFNDLKGWRYIGTLSMPFDIELYDIYLRTGVGIEPFELMTKFDHNRNSVYIGGQKAVYEHETQTPSPLAYAYDYAISEGEL